VTAQIDQGDDLPALIERGDVVVDFSSHLATARIAALCAEYKKAMVIGTTGHSKEDLSRITKLSSQIPMVLSSNFSTGVNALFWLTPAEMTSHDPLGLARRMADAGASILRKHPDLHVVQLSSAGAFLPSGTGPIVGLYETEEKFRAAGKNIVSLRPNEFMENVFFSLPTIIQQDSIYTSISGAVKAQFIATQDIAEVAAEFLLNPVDGHHVIDLVGPQEISFNEWARIAGQAIGKQIRVVTVPGDQLKAAMSKSGMSPEMAALLVEMEEASPQILGQFKGDQKRVGKVTFAQFAREVFAPAYKKAVQQAA